jgi:adenylyltransferase/sulfurtransferase
MYLAAAGVGTLALADGDRVDLTNLQRQILHATASVGKAKVESGRETLARLNPQIKVEALEMRLEGPVLDLEVSRADVVLDCSDNFQTRHAINSACVRHGKALVSGAGVRFDGQITVFDLRRPDSACYECLFPSDAELEETRCAVMGVFAPLTGILGTMQAAEAIKLLADVGETLNGRLLLLDALKMEWRSVRLRKDPDCRVCGEPAQARLAQRG